MEIKGPLKHSRAKALISLEEKISKEIPDPKYISKTSIIIEKKGNKYRAYANINWSLEGYSWHLRKLSGYDKLSKKGQEKMDRKVDEWFRELEEQNKAMAARYEDPSYRSFGAPY